MNRKTYRILTLLFGIVAFLGLIRLAGGVSAVNAGIFLCPFALAIFTFVKDRKTNK